MVIVFVCVLYNVRIYFVSKIFVLSTHLQAYFSFSNHFYEPAALTNIRSITYTLKFN